MAGPQIGPSPHGRAVAPHNRCSLAPRPSPLRGIEQRSQGGTPLTELQSVSLSGEAARTGEALGGRRFRATKVVPPRCPGLIDRPRLPALASRLTAKRLAVMKAPAGFGKTSLAARWSDGLRESASSGAWLGINSGEDEPSRTRGQQDVYAIAIRQREQCRLRVIGLGLARAGDWAGSPAQRRRSTLPGRRMRGAIRIDGTHHVGVGLGLVGLPQAGQFFDRG
jgi:hypothetical protein